ncbi:MAG: hypothetical protein IMZ55_17225, partial [Acidobacteria bacterium]|nr:hypothetical protein [Acidobacteriota bacterium]
MSTGSNTTKIVRRVAWGLAAAVAITLIAFLIHAATVTSPWQHLSFVPDPGTWRGVYHVHTRASDGLGTVEDVVAAARMSGATWVLVVDHNRMDAAQPRIVDGVLLVFSPEVSAPDGHVTALGASRALTRQERRAKDALATIRALGGAPVAAHPLGRKRPYARLDDPDLAGLEILSADQEFRDAFVSPFRLLPAALAYTVNPKYAVLRLLQRPGRTLSRWDELLRSRRVAGFCAVDAHGRPPYGVMMESLQMHAVVGHPRTGDAVADGQALIDALARGRSFCGVETIAGAGGFRFGGITDADEVTMGGDARLDLHPVLHLDLAYASLPPGARPVLI